MASTLHSLDLSNNLFNEIPDSLATLSNLRALNLSNCMISSLHSLSRNPLPAITVLNLRSNRLPTLAGVERLFSLEKLDIRDNKLTDPTELARLTRIPDIQHVWVHKNPFTRTHTNYRVTIFNLFRSSPGYTEDIMIDTLGPSYGEKRQLVDRVPEPENTPVVPIKEMPEQTQKALPPLPIEAEPAVKHDKVSTETDRLETQRMQASQKRRKVARRRIVELSEQEQTSPSAQRTEAAQLQSSEEATTLSKAPPSAQRGQSDNHTAQSQANAPVLAPLDTRDVSPSPVRPSGSAPFHGNASPPNESEGISITSDIYRQKIEALKNDFGNGWLTALNEDKWDGRNVSQDREFTSPGRIRPVRADSRGVAVGGRTLG